MLTSARPRSWLGAVPTRFSVTSGMCRNQFFDAAEVDPDTSQSNDSVPATSGADQTQSADTVGDDEKTFEAEFKAIVDSAVQSVAAEKDAEIQRLTAERDAAIAARKPSLAGQRAALAKVSQLYGGGAPVVRKGESTMSSRGYEMQRALGNIAGAPSFDKEHCKLEIQMSDWLKERMMDFGFTQASSDAIRPAILVPMSLDSLPHQLQKEFSQKFCNGQSDGLSQLFAQSTRGADAGSVANSLLREIQRSGVTAEEFDDLKQTLGTLTTASGGLYLDPAWNGEMIPLLLAIGAHYRLGITAGMLPANGMDRIGREDSIPTAYMVGEGQNITASEGTLGDVNFKAKKMAALVKWNNELSRFGGPVAEARIRSGIARAMTKKEGELILYGTAETTTSWCGVHSFAGRINYTDSGTSQNGVTLGSNGNTFKPEGVAEIPAYLADASLLDVEAEGGAWLMRSMMLSNILNKRGAVYNGTDTSNTGEFMFDGSRGDATRGIAASLGGFPVVKTTEVAKTRSKGSSSILTSVIFAVWKYLHIRRIGVMELAVSTQGDTPFVSDQTWLRAIQHVDVKATRENAFLVADYIDQAA